MDQLQAKDFLSVKEVAERCGLSEVTIRRYAKAGKLPCFQPFGEKGWHLFPPDCIEKSGSLSGNNNAHDSVTDDKPKKLAGRQPGWLSSPTS